MSTLTRILMAVSVLVVVSALLIVASRLGAVVTDSSAGSATSDADFSANPVSAPEIDAQAALALLANVTASEAASDQPYDRDRFGQRWADVDRNGCDTRNDILGRDLSSPVYRQGTNDCTVETGELTDPYDGHREAFASGEQTSPLVQIDHIVALSWAWRHGADDWSDADRLGFANDPANLVATSDQLNAAKGDAGPGEWLPPREASVCGFVIAWVAVVAAYDLGIGADDRRAAQSVLAGC